MVCSKMSFPALLALASAFVAPFQGPVPEPYAPAAPAAGFTLTAAGISAATLGAPAGPAASTNYTGPLLALAAGALAGGWAARVSTAAVAAEGAKVDAKTVKKLRDLTGAGMMDCKKALVDANGDFDAASEELRKKGLASAEKKASRKASEGIVETYIHTDANGDFDAASEEL